MAANTASPRESSPVPGRGLAPVQWTTALASIVLLIWSVPGLIVNPDFAIGDGATSERIMGVDMNGWHALSGLALGLPGLLFARRRLLSALFSLAAAGGLVATGVWALASTTVAGGLFYFPHNEVDAVLHFATAALYLSGAAHYFRAQGGWAS